MNQRWPTRFLVFAAMFVVAAGCPHGLVFCHTGDDVTIRASVHACTQVFEQRDPAPEGGPVVDSCCGHHHHTPAQRVDSRPPASAGHDGCGHCVDVPILLPTLSRIADDAVAVDTLVVTHRDLLLDTPLDLALRIRPELEPSEPPGFLERATTVLLI